MKKYRVWIIVLNLVLLLTYFNYSIFKKEQTLNQGQLILFELAPVDPRSLMQGDYMILDYALTRHLEQLNVPNEPLPKRGYVVLGLDAHQVAHYIRVQDTPLPLNASEYLIKYTSPGRYDIHLGAESYFFQEGHAQRYEQAKYGGLKVDLQGNSILVGLYNDKFQKIE